ncbi:MAG TPA: sugar phosphate isomerase/epimerase [Acidimicrobiales bacterium]|nr:sugar phosphate isomerase/epimerase [Acidimicrobiales bacterium]
MPFPSSPVVAGSTLALQDRARDDRTTWQQDLSSLRRAGFLAVDLVDSWLAPANLPTADRAFLRECLAQEGLRLVGLSLIRRSIIDPEHARENMAYTHSSIETAHSLGAQVVSIGFHRPLTEEQKGAFPFWAVPGPRDPVDRATRHEAVRSLRELCHHAKDMDVVLSLELYEDTLLGSGRAAAALVEDVAEDNMGINADLANLWRQPVELGEHWRETLARCLPYMNYWHVKNFRRAPVWPAGPFVTFPCPLADGDIDYHEAFQMAAAAGYAGPICIEHYGGDRLWAQKAALEYVMWLLTETEPHEQSDPKSRGRLAPGAI